MSINFWISIFSFVCFIGVARLLTQLKSFSFLNGRSSRFETVDGLRGFLALSVFFHHFVITFYWKLNGAWTRPPEDYYQNYGKVGVGIFFMITGFLFVSKILKDKESLNWLKLYESRFFRIFPLYVFAVVSITIVAFDSAGYQLNSSLEDILKQLIRWGLFIGGNINEFQDSWIVIAGVDWTLKYEWLFYFSLPFLSFALLKGRLPAVAIIIFLCIVFFVRPIGFTVFTTKYFLLFAVGGISSWLVSSHSFKIDLSGSKIASIVAVLFILSSLFYPRTFDLFHVMIISLLFVFVVLGCDLFGLLRMKSAIILGEISYSIYLLHGLVLYFIFTHLQVVDIKNMDSTTYSLFMPLIGIVVIILSSLTYLFIEKPFLEIGKEYRITKALKLLVTNANKALQRTSR
ncbi:MAG: acyltransferase [Candidatus Competibacteraceae bacterium]|nr:MAG: acyltransferase [Candidatus Competibacteraceae bacterium]